MRSITPVLVLALALGLAAAAQVALGRETPGHEADALAQPTLLEPVASIPLRVIPSDFVATPDEIWATAGIEGVIGVDPHTGRVRARIRTDGAVIAALADDGLWAVDVSGDRLLEIDRRHQRVGRAVRVDGLPTGVAAAGGRLWVMGQEFASVTVIDARSLERVAVLRFAPSELWPTGIIAGPRGIWLITGWRDELSLIDPRTLDVIARVETPRIEALAATADSLWASRSAEGGSGLVRVDPATLAATIVDLPGEGPVTALAGGNTLQVAVPGAFLELDLLTGETIARRRISRRYRVTGLALIGRDLWASDEATGELLLFRLPQSPVRRR